MSKIIEVSVPDIGGAKGVDVIELLVAPGDQVKAESSLITLEGDKATMEIPSPYAGVVRDMKVKVGDKVSQGSLILTLEVADAATKTEQKPASTQQAATQTQPGSTSPKIVEVLIPDIGGAKDVDVIELLVAPGDQVKAESSLITLEGDKATMEIPSPYAGVVRDMQVKVGDKVSQGSLILTLEVADAAAPAQQQREPAQPQPAAATQTPAQPAAAQPPTTEIHAGPGVRRLAREFGVDLNQVPPTGTKNRILKEDVQRFVKSALTRGATGTAGGLAVAPAPVIDFSQFGEIETKPLNKIKKLTGVNVHRSWVTVPHVTQFAEADITELEAFREQQKAAAEKKGVKLTPLVFIMKAVVAALKAFPHFNASLDPSGEQLILKKYVHLGVAVDTPNGLVVPVVRDVDKKGLYALAEELAKISSKARDKGLSMADMQGGCFTISSLGGIGGTAFTPIVNTPEVAILGVSKASIKPVYQGNTFVPRLMLPLSLSYDHRVIDGADGARFSMYLTSLLSDIRTLLL